MQAADLGVFILVIEGDCIPGRGGFVKREHYLPFYLMHRARPEGFI